MIGKDRYKRRVIFAWFFSCKCPRPECYRGQGQRQPVKAAPSQCTSPLDLEKPLFVLCCNNFLPHKGFWKAQFFLGRYDVDVSVAQVETKNQCFIEAKSRLCGEHINEAEVSADGGKSLERLSLKPHRGRDRCLLFYLKKVFFPARHSWDKNANIHCTQARP